MFHLDENVPPPPLTASIEGCTAVIFKVLSDEVCCEIDLDGEDGQERKRIRRAIRAALLERGINDAPDIECTDYGNWQSWIDALSDEILFDRDFEDVDDYVDLPPDAAREAYHGMHIDPEYFLHVLDDPPESKWPAMEKELFVLADEGAKST